MRRSARRARSSARCWTRAPGASSSTSATAGDRSPSRRHGPCWPTASCRTQSPPTCMPCASTDRPSTRSPPCRSSCLGMPLGDVIAASTVIAAMALRRRKLGSLKPGSVGDATILSIREASFDYVDVVGEHLTGDRRIASEGVVLAGRWWHPQPLRQPVRGAARAGGERPSCTIESRLDRACPSLLSRREGETAYPRADRRLRARQPGPPGGSVTRRHLCKGFQCKRAPARLPWRNCSMLRIEASSLSAASGLAVCLTV